MYGKMYGGEEDDRLSARAARGPAEARGGRVGEERSGADPRRRRARRRRRAGPPTPGSALERPGDPRRPRRGDPPRGLGGGLILLDTGGAPAPGDAREPRHVDARRALLGARTPLLLSPFVLAELDYLI